MAGLLTLQESFFIGICLEGFFYGKMIYSAMSEPGKYYLGPGFYSSFRYTDSYIFMVLPAIGCQRS